MTTDPRPPLRSKSATRRTLTARRDAMLPAARDAASGVIASAVDTLLASVPPTAIVALYAAKDSEVDTLAIDRAARARGLRVAYPRVVAGQRALAFHLATPAELVTGGRFGLREPTPDAPIAELADVGLMVVPGLAFDRTGGRLGWGFGHYDETLAAAPPAGRTQLVGIAFHCQLVEALPVEAHDIPLDVVITEVATHVVGPPPAGAPR